MAVWFDHLVIGAEDLDVGAAWAMETLGVRPPLGGAHPLMATHNRLGRLPHGYLEIIARDPAATPQRTRWYGLDDSTVRARIAERPRPVAFVLATDDIEETARAAPWTVGEIIEARRGDLAWKIGLRDDGRVVEGVLPVFIEWPAALDQRAPRDQMADLGLALRALRLRHPKPDLIRTLLADVGADAAMVAADAPIEVIEAATPSIEAMFTPSRFDARI